MKSIEQVESIQDLKDIRNECSGRSVFRPFPWRSSPAWG